MGSEMCIRDRDRSVRRHCAVVDALVEQHRAARADWRHDCACCSASAARCCSTSASTTAQWRRTERSVMSDGDEDIVRAL